MNLRVILVLLLIVPFFAQAQKEPIKGMNECKLVHDKKTNREYFKDLEYEAELPDGFNVLEFVKANFRLPKKKYNPKEKISFAYIVEKDGVVSFLKLLTLTTDKEIEDEAKRITGLMPKWLAARCGKDYVASMHDISFSVDWMHETLSR